MTKKSTGVDFSKPLTDEQKNNHRKMVKESYNQKTVYSESQMVKQPDDTEDWIVPGYNHGHK